MYYNAIRDWSMLNAKVETFLRNVPEETNVFADGSLRDLARAIGAQRRIAGVYNMRSCTSLRKTNDPLGRETVSVRREALATKKRLLVPSLPPG